MFSFRRHDRPLCTAVVVVQSGNGPIKDACADGAAGEGTGEAVGQLRPREEEEEGRHGGGEGEEEGKGTG